MWIMYGLLGKGTMAAHAHTHTDTPHTHTDTNKTLNRGWNLYGQLGQGTTADAYAPMPVRYFLEVGAKARRVCCGVWLVDVAQVYPSPSCP